MKNTCKDKAKLPASFRDLGMQENIAAIFDVAGMTPAKMIDKAREYGLYDHLTKKKDGKLHLSIKNPWEEDTLIPTGMEAGRVVGSDRYGIGWMDAHDAGHLRVNFHEVGIPYLSDYIRDDASKQCERIEREFEMPYLEGSFNMDSDAERRVRKCVRELCLEHYEHMEMIHANPEPTAEKLVELIGREFPCWIDDYNRLLAKARENEGRELKVFHDPLMGILRQLSRWSEVSRLVEEAFYVQGQQS
ncbi:hypothetical protein IKX12_01940 [Candidatus Saccharibacteria bacterium]|nr:hypothetical protein [Candidatus Saccharibacteria bacterium]